MEEVYTGAKKLQFNLNTVTGTFPIMSAAVGLFPRDSTTSSKLLW